MKIAVIGGGPAGLRAAEVAAAGGAEVTLFDAMASVGRKFLVAGRGGLNLTNAEPHERFVRRYLGRDTPPEIWSSLLADFDAEALRTWAAGLGIETFAASTGRVYPRELKAAPLLRRWVQRLRGLGVHFAMHHRWTGLHPGAELQLQFEAQDRPRTFATDALILALGGGSWPATGSDGGWVSTLEKLGVGIAPLQPANCGWELSWPAAVLIRAEGQPLKNIAVRAGPAEALGELLITSYGLEGGALYELGTVLRSMAEPEISIDFKPDLSLGHLVKKMTNVRDNLFAEARQRWRLGEPALAILENMPDGAPLLSISALAHAVKNCPLVLTGPRPLAEAISSAGGVLWSELNEMLMLRQWPGVFVAGEMIDWEAPTGGYLLPGCFATGARAAHGALAWRR